jgi:hypothetical protein
MDTLTKQVRRAQRRLALQRFIAALGWCWFAALVVAVLLIIAGKLRWLEVDAWIWGAGALVAGLVGAAVWALVSSLGAIDAAMEVDRRFALKERISSALALSPEELDTEAGQALLKDAVRRADRIDVDDRFRIKPPRLLLLPLAPGLLALLVAVLVSPAVIDNPAEAEIDRAAVKKAIQKAGNVLAEKLQKQRRQAQKQDLKEAKELFDKLDRQMQDLTAKADGDRVKTLVKLNDLNKELQKRRQKLGGAEDAQRQLRQLNKVGGGPADKFAKAISRGDFRKAMKELDKLKEDLAGGKLSDQQKAELTQQLDQMKDKLQKLADAKKAAEKDLQDRLNKARQAGNAAQASKLEEQLDKLRQQGPQMNQLQDLASKLGQCSKCMKNGQLQDAAAKLGQLQGDLKDLNQQLEEMAMIDDAMGELAQMRDQINGCKCNGGGNGDDKEGEPGDGMGRGRGKGFRPEQKTDYNTRDSHVRQKIGRGSASVVDLVDGPNVKGNVQQEVKAALEAAQAAESDPITSQRMPRKHRQQVQEYFDRLHQEK